MSTTTFQNQQFATTDVAEATPQRKPLWRRAFDALVESQQRRADREIGRFVANHGGLMTDDMERQIMEHLSRRSRPSV